MERWDAVVIGSGWTGLALATVLAQRLARVLVLERAPELMPLPQAYPTCFAQPDWSPLIPEHHHRSLTRIARNVNSSAQVGVGITSYLVRTHNHPRQLERDDDSIQPDRELLTLDTSGLFNPAIIASIARYHEPIVDAANVRSRLIEQAVRSGVELRTHAGVRSVWSHADGAVGVQLTDRRLSAGCVLSCTRTQANSIATASQLPVLPLEHELVELAIVQTPPELRHSGIMILDDAVAGLVPIAARGLHTLYHSRYSTHGHWYDGLPGEPHVRAEMMLERVERRSASAHIIGNMARVVPSLVDSTYHGSIWCVKSSIPGTETDESLPYQLAAHHGIPNYHLAISAYPDTIDDLIHEVVATLGGYQLSRLAAA